MRSRRKSKSLLMQTAAAAAARLRQRETDEAAFKAFFKEVETTKGRPLARRAIDTAPVEPGLHRLIPRVMCQAKIEKMHEAQLELSQNFFVKAFEVGLSLYEPSYSYTQYASFLLLGASQPLSTMQRRAEREGVLGEEATGETINALTKALPSKQQVRQELCSYEQATAQLQQLRQRLRVPAMMVWVDGLGVQETAEALNVRRGTISSRLHRARAKLTPLLLPQPETASPPAN